MNNESRARCAAEKRHSSKGCAKARCPRSRDHHNVLDLFYFRAYALSSLWNLKMLAIRCPYGSTYGSVDQHNAQNDKPSCAKRGWRPIKVSGCRLFIQTHFWKFDTQISVSQTLLPAFAPGLMGARGVANNSQIICLIGFLTRHSTKNINSHSRAITLLRCFALQRRTFTRQAKPRREERSENFSCI